MLSIKSKFKARKGDLRMPLVHVKKNFQITIPQQLRSVLKIKEGDLMEAEIADGIIVLKPKSVVDKIEANRQEWVNKLIEVGAQNPTDVSEEEIVRDCKEIRKEIYKEKYGEN